MKRITQCPICNSQNINSFKAGISPFLQDRIFKFRGPKNCKFLHCKDCDLYFFDVRPDANEMSLLYAGYRSDEYQIQRHRYEPLYTKDFNEKLGKNAIERESRIENLEKILSANIDSTSIDILDYGGNDGCMIPPSITGNKFCYDISGVQPVKGVRKIGDSELKLHHYDLIMLCHVLEHVSLPVDFLSNVTELMSEGSYLYVELPDDLESQLRSIKNSKTFLGRIKHIIKCFRPRWRWIMPQLSYSTGPQLHEHINCYSNMSLKKLCIVSGLEIVEIGKKRLNFGWADSDILYCLARKPS